MAEHNARGLLGEEEACRYLARHHYRLLDRNWRHGHLELDIVADYFGEVVFVEVKARQNEHFAPAEEAVDRQKREHLLQAAKAYMAGHGLDQPVRFDIITVVGRQAPFEIRHIVNAFDPQTAAAERQRHGTATR